MGPTGLGWLGWLFFLRVLLGINRFRLVWLINFFNSLVTRLKWLKTMGIDRYHNRGIRGLLSVCVMSTNKMAETINMEEYLQLVSLPATEFEETHNFSTKSPAAVLDEEIFMRWSDESVKLLIALYQEHERKFADVNYKNKSVWEIIAAGMRGKGYCPTWVQCSNKWKQLKKSFVEAFISQ